MRAKAKSQSQEPEPRVEAEAAIGWRQLQRIEPTFILKVLIVKVTVGDC